MKTWLQTMMVCALLTGCANGDNACGGKILALAPDGTGQFQFQEVHLDTLKNPYELNGEAAQIYYESVLNEKGFSGKIAQPRYTRAGDLCVPMDAQSSLAVSIYAVVEKIYKFDLEIGIAHMMSWPRKVGVDIIFNENSGLYHNNAFYAGINDTTTVLPYSQGLVPMGLNIGILGHEHFHAHFQRQVLSALDAQPSVGGPALDLERLFYAGFGAAPGRKPTIEDASPNNIRRPRNLNAFVLRAWNEGLADFYGVVISGDPRFFEMSAPQLRDTRSLDLEVRPVMPAVMLERNASLNVVQPQKLEGLSYEQGANIARVLYQIMLAQKTPPREFLVTLVNRLREIPPAIRTKYDVQTLEFEEVLPILLKDVPLNRSSCDVLRKAVSKAMINGSFGACVGI